MNIKKCIALAVGLTVLAGCSNDQLEPIPLNKDRVQSQLNGEALTTALYRVTEKSNDSEFLVAEPLDRAIKLPVVVEAAKYEIGDIVKIGIDENGEIISEEKKNIPSLQEGEE